MPCDDRESEVTRRVVCEYSSRFNFERGWNKSSSETPLQRNRAAQLGGEASSVAGTSSFQKHLI